MALKQKFIFVFLTTAVFLISLRCSKKPSYDKLIEYIKAEKNLRARIGQARSIEDSVKALSDKYGVDLTESYTDLFDNPEAWVKILQALENEK